MRKRTSSGGLSKRMNIEMGSNIDLSLLRRPLTPFTGFQEARSAFDKGTTEVRHLLLFECGLIYECNVCRNMFRSLANFISHKRVFCCTFSKDYSGTHHSANGSDGMQSSRHHSREYKIAKHEAELRQKIAESMEISSNRQATSEPVSAIIDVEAEEENQTQCETKTEEDITQKIKSSKGVEKQRDDNAKPTDRRPQKVREIPETAYVFQCPSCSLTFRKSSAVICHLAIAHNIPIRRIRMMRDSLLKCRTESTAADNLEKPKALKKSRELKGLFPMNESSSSSDCDEKKDTEHDQTAFSSKCLFCQKSFERRAVLATHMQSCPIQKEMSLERQEQAVAAPTGKRVKLETESQDTMPKEATIAADIDCQIVEPKESNETVAGIRNSSLETEDVKQTFVDLENQSFGPGLQTVSIDKLDISAGESSNASLGPKTDNPVATVDDTAPQTNLPEATETENPLSTEISSATTKTTKNRVATVSSIKKRRMRLPNAQSCRCKLCGKQFNALSNLRRHISMFHYRSRKFGCALCDYCAFRRYDIINHLNFVHKLDTDNTETMSKDLVRVNEVSYTKDDMNDDIVLCSIEELKLEATASDEKEPKPNVAASDDNKDQTDLNDNKQTKMPMPEKRQRRRRHNKSLSALNDNNILHTGTGTSNDEVKLTRQKLKRSQSQTLESTTASKGNHTQKRPKRNRTKPVNKDFVYDLSAVTKKDASQACNSNTESCETYQLRGSKRRNATNVYLENIPPVPPFDLLKVKHSDAIKGSARRASLILVSQGLAASSTLPEIPAERPLMRPRLTSTQRSDSQAGPIIETTELEAASRLKSLPLCDDSYLEKIAKESVGSFTMKPCLEHQQHSALDSLLQKVDSSKQLNGIARNLSNQNQINIQARNIKQEELNPFAFLNSSLFDAGTNNNDELALTTLPSYLTTPEQEVRKALSFPIKPQKRLPSLDRLNETINSFENFYNAQLNN